MNRVKEYSRAELEAMPVAGAPDSSLRGFIRAEIQAGNISGVTGTQVAGMDKLACVALLLGEAAPLAATPAAPMMPLASTISPAGSGDAMAPLAAMLAPHLAAMGIGGAVNADEVRQLAAQAFADQVTPTVQKVDGFINALASKFRDLSEEMLTRRAVEITIVRQPEETRLEIGLQHHTFPTLLAMLEAGCNVWLVGPAGSGKTTAAEMAARALGLKFYFNGAIDSEYKLLGFTDAQGRIVSRPFREAWEKGGVYLFDEVDASLPSALLAFNAALSNGFCDFPDGCIPCHPEFKCIAGGNVWNGATAEYCGRMKQDAAFLDRFVQLEWVYDETLELEIACQKAAPIATARGTKPTKAREQAAAWVARVQAWRAAAKQHGCKVVISPRASITGAKMLAAGKLELATVIQATVRRGLDDGTWAKVNGGTV